MTLAQERDVWTEYQHAEGAERARIEEELVREHAGLAHYVMQKNRSHAFDYEDLKQIAMIALLTSVRTFQPELNNKFSTYAVQVVKTTLLNYYRDENTHKRRANILTFSLNTPVAGDDDMKTEWEDNIPDQDPLVEKQVTDSIITEKVMKIAERHFTDQEAAIFHMRFPKYGEPVPFQTIGKQFGVSGNAIMNTYRNIIFKLTQCYNGADPEEVFAPRRKTWSDEENEKLRKVLLDGMSRKEVYKLFPDRTKGALDQKITNTRKKLRKEGLL